MFQLKLNLGIGLMLMVLKSYHDCEFLFLHFIISFFFFFLMAYIVFFFFLIGNKTFIEKIEHHVHDSEHYEQETDTV